MFLLWLGLEDWNWNGQACVKTINLAYEASDEGAGANLTPAPSSGHLESKNPPWRQSWGWTGKSR